MKILKKVSLVLLTLSFIFLLSGCAVAKKSMVNVLLSNKSSSQAYMWIGHQDQPSAADLVAPGGFKMVQLELQGLANSKDEPVFQYTDKIKANASPDGAQKVQSDLPIQFKYDAAKQIYIDWDGKALNANYR